jgi:hypothetical protein
MASATASVAKAAGHTTDHSVRLAQAGEGHPGPAAEPMDDCASMIKGNSGDDNCPHCSKDKACPPEFCLTKCFQFFDVNRTAGALVRIKKTYLRQTQPELPPGWLEQPQPPPPRT